MYGGIDARMLSVLSDPGPMTDAKTGGSGFLCLENDGPTAERIATLLDEAGIAASDMNPRNAYPWYIPEVSLTARERSMVRASVPIQPQAPRSGKDPMTLSLRTTRRH
jgi:hypothetical protein